MSIIMKYLGILMRYILQLFLILSRELIGKLSREWIGKLNTCEEFLALGLRAISTARAIIISAAITITVISRQEFSIGWQILVH